MAGYIRWFAEIGARDVALVGGKNASLGEMYQHLRGEGLPVPNGFAVTAEAYRALLAENQLEAALRRELADVDLDDAASLSRAARRCREAVYDARLPDGLSDQIIAAHHKLEDEYGADLTVAVRSSATAEDLPEASFAGQHDSYLNVAGGSALLEAYRRCLASLFTERAIQYRAKHGFDHLHVALSVCIMKMVRSDLGASGVIFTLDTESGHPGVVLITAAYGLGENIVQGTVDPDEFYVHKETLRQGHRWVLRRQLGDKKLRMVYAERQAARPTRNQPTAPEERGRYCISDSEVVNLAEMSLKIEDHYSSLASRPVPMDIEWARDGVDGQLYVVQARPETVASRRRGDVLVSYDLSADAPPIVTGRAVGQSVVAAPVRVVRDPEDLSEFRDGEVLVADSTTPDWGAVMRKAAALITNRGGRTCHAAIVARELDIPAVVGCGNATEVLTDGQLVTVSCAQGETGRVYEGALPFDRTETDLSGLSRPRTKMMMNLGNPDVAFQTAGIPNDGVGLARLEFIISDHVRMHPMAAVHPERLTSESDRRAIAALSRNDRDPREYFVRTLAEGVATIAAAFYPNPVVVRLSDFKTNEYARLLGGSVFEPAEENPMLGFRGAARYAHPAYEEGFALECAAMRRVREEMGFTNVKLMIPFCRRVDEAERVLACMAKHGLERGRAGLEIYVMCEIPNNVILIDEFARHFDGFSIGSNDLTQLTLGVDRDSETVAFDFDERDPGVMKMLEMAVAGAKRNGRHSGICGQAPSDYPEVAEFLVRAGIDSLSLNPDSVLSTTLAILDLEQGLPSNPEGG